MVVSKNWAVIYHVSEEILKPLEKFLLIANLAENTYKSWGEMARIYNSNIDSMSKAEQLSGQVTSVVIRTLASGITSGAHLLAKSASGYLQFGDILGVPQAHELNAKLLSLDKSFQSGAEKITDGHNINYVMQKYITIK